ARPGAVVRVLGTELFRGNLSMASASAEKQFRAGRGVRARRGEPAHRVLRSRRPADGAAAGRHRQPAVRRHIGIGVVRSRHPICLVTDRRRLSPDADDAVALDRLVTLVASAAHAGVNLIQIRERDLEARALADLCARCLAAAAATTSQIVVNDRLDVALAAGANGVHLRSDSVDASTARTLAPSGFLMGRSVHGAREAGEIAQHGGVDYLICGTVFSSASKPGGPSWANPDELARACADAPVPVLAIGGIDEMRAEAAAKARAAGVAAIGLFIPPAGVPVDRHLERIIAALRRVFDTCGVVP